MKDYYEFIVLIVPSIICDLLLEKKSYNAYIIHIRQTTILPLFDA